MIIIKPPVLSTYGNTSRLSSLMITEGIEKELWFEVDNKFKSFLTEDTSDSFFLAAVLLSMKTGEDITVEGTLSSKLYYNVTRYLIPMLAHFFERALTINVSLSRTNCFMKEVQGGVITGFSGGVDSFSTYYNHSSYADVPEEYKVSHLIYNNVGSHGVGLSSETIALFEKRQKALAQYASSEGMVFIGVNSNLEDLLGLAFQKTHTVRNTLVALLFQKSISKYLYASTVELKETTAKNHYDIAYLDPIILPLMSTERMECIAVGGELQRVEKTRQVTEIPDNEKFLDVCVLPDLILEGYINCGLCWKCFRTELTLKILGKLECYTGTFPVRYFEKYENLYLIKVLSSDDPLLQEIVRLIKRKEYPVPLWVKIASRILPRFLTRLIDYKISIFEKITNR